MRDREGCTYGERNRRKDISGKQIGRRDSFVAGECARVCKGRPRCPRASGMLCPAANPESAPREFHSDASGFAFVSGMLARHQDVSYTSLPHAKQTKRTRTGEQGRDSRLR